MLSLPALHGPPLPLPLSHHHQNNQYPAPPSSAPAFTTTNHHPHHNHPPGTQNPTTRLPPSPHLLRLTQEESLLSRRRTHIARFGSSWLRPPGVPKTLAGMEDEILERAEAEQMRAREADILMLAAEAEAEAEVEEEEEEEEGEGMEQDLDAGVPEGDEGWTEDEDEEEEGEEVGYGGDGDDGEEEGGIEGLGMFEGEGDYAPPPQPPPRRPQQRFDNTNATTAAMPLPEWATAVGVTPRTPVAAGAGMGTPMTGMEMSEGGDLDLDAGVPEAGDYEHTDTEVEDASTDDDDGWAAGSSRHHAVAGVGRSTHSGGPGDSLVGAQYRVRSGGVIAPTPRGETPGYGQGQGRSGQALSHPQRESAGRERSTRRSERRRNAYQTPSFDAGLGSSGFDDGSGLEIGEDSLLGGSVFGSSPLTVSMGGFDGMGGGAGDGRVGLGLASGVSGSGGGIGRNVSDGRGRQGSGGSAATARNQDSVQAEAAAAYRQRDRRGT